MAGQDASPAGLAHDQSGAVEPHAGTARKPRLHRSASAPVLIVQIEPDSVNARAMVGVVLEALDGTQSTGHLCRSVAELGRRVNSIEAACMVIPVSGQSLEAHIAAIESLATIAPALRRILVGQPSLRKDPYLADFLMRGLLYDFMVLPQELREFELALRRTSHLASIEAETRRSAMEIVPSESQMVG
ncbi:MAG TPA: hypothetical protein VEH07_08635, partial [Alphaproteobacteria bacterium]|nr:hypothetical protein [Alphaproteobacteria bacterium]